VAAYSDTISRQTARLEGFSRMVSHELRQPLGALQYAGHLLHLAKDGDGVQRERLVEVINRNVTQLIDLTGKLETLCRLSDAAEDAHRQETDLELVMNEVARQLHEMAEARGVDLSIASAAPIVMIDVARVELILMNLASNAIKYTDPDKPLRTVELSAAWDAGTCILQVRDNGLGIPEAHLESIFRRFYRAHPDRDEELGASGSGLGLFITQECVTALRGTISVASMPGVGTTFTVTLPAAT
jgi:signal transduction histidine kinase